MRGEAVTAEEYEDRRRRLADETEAARVALNTVRVRYDQLCAEARTLRLEWREQQAREARRDRNPNP